MTSCSVSMFNYTQSDGPATHPLGLRALISEEIERKGSHCDLNHLDISQTSSLAGVFANLSFHGSIEHWDTSHIVSLKNTFLGSSFNGDISRWDTRAVQDMQGAFERSSFNSDISNWDTSRVVTMSRMFAHSSFNGDLSKWSLSALVSMDKMFMDSVFNGDISRWCVDDVATVEELFKGCPFKGNLSAWRLSILADVSNIVDIGFEGVLPRMQSPSVDPHSSYSRMMGARRTLDHYLARMPLNSVHADIIANHTMRECPTWLNAADYQWFEEKKTIFTAMSCTPDESYNLLLAAIAQRALTPMTISSADLNAIGL